MTEPGITESGSRLKNFPVSGFSLVMGMAGFTIAWSRAEHVFSLPFSISPALLAFTAFFFIGLMGLIVWASHDAIVIPHV